MRRTLLLAALAISACCRPAPAPNSKDAAAASATAAPAIACPPRLEEKTEAELESLVAKNDACAMSALGGRLGSVRDAAAFRRAAELLKRAHQAGVNTSRCDVFYDGIGMAPEHALAAACMERGGYIDELAVLFISGDGVPRDLSRAEKLIGTHQGSCTTDAVRKLIEVEKKSSSKKAYNYCEDAACTTPEIAECMLRKERVKQWQSMQKQGQSLAGLSEAERALYNQLVAARDKYENEDVDQHSYIFIDGTYRSIAAMGRKTGISDEFNRLFEQIAASKPTEPASNEELKKARADLTAAEKRLLGNVGPKTMHFDPAEHRKRWDKAKASWAVYRDAWIRFGTARAGNDDGIRTRIELLVTRARIETLDTGSPD